ncbi:MAG TPA: DUF1343 domain-containing protein [Polyangia bacterium]|jgi:uncharacterized protein YbbC (DUF1343 family)
MIRVGIDRVLEEELGVVAGKRLGLICNPTSVDAELRHTADLLTARPDLDLVALFGPEHGVRGDAQDMISVGEARDARTGLPVHSLYGETEASLSPAPEALAGLDAVVFDIQDVGSRYYTYVWTLALAMRAAARAGVEVIVLDRPNPLGGLEVEGGLIADGFRSFVGLYPVPNRHGLTAGEIAGYLNAVYGLGARLTVVRAAGWRREQLFDETGLPWVLPSPNMPTLDTALVYPGMCLVEGTELSEGRGTTRPFELCGAPFIDGFALAGALAAEDLPGVRFRPVTFRPSFHKFAGRPCGGVQLHVTDRRTFRPLRTGVAVLRAIRALWPGELRWRHAPYEFVTDRPAIDLLCGGPTVREMIDAGEPVAAIMATLRADEAQFRAAREPYLLY